MIVIKICMWPLGNKEKEYDIARAYITNDAKTTFNSHGKLGSYDVKIMQSNKYDTSKVWKKGRIEDFDRQKRGVWDLLYLCLKAVGIDKRNKVKEPHQNEEKYVDFK